MYLVRLLVTFGDANLVCDKKNHMSPNFPIT